MHTNVAWTGLFEQNMHNLCLTHHWTWACGNNDDMMLELSHSIHYCVIISVLLHPRQQEDNGKINTKKVSFWQPWSLTTFSTPANAQQGKKKKKSFLFMYVLNTHERLGNPCNAKFFFSTQHVLKLICTRITRIYENWLPLIINNNKNKQ